MKSVKSWKGRGGTTKKGGWAGDGVGHAAAVSTQEDRGGDTQTSLSFGLSSPPGVTHQIPKGKGSWRCNI